MKQLSLAVVVVVLFAGCGMGPFKTFTTLPPPVPQLLRSYTMGQTHTAGIGDPIFTVRQGYPTMMYSVVREFQPPELDGRPLPLLRPGMRFEAYRGIKDESGYLLYDPAYHPIAGFVINEEGTVNYGEAFVRLDAIMVSRARMFFPNTTLSVGDTVSGSHTHNAAKFPKEKLFSRSADSLIPGPFRAEMIYSGLTGNTMKAVYREYINDQNRPAFTTELQYNLDESKTIAYKSIKIEVTRATNQQIEYRIISDDNLPWMK